MKTNEIPKLIASLEARVTLSSGTGPPTIAIAEPTVDDLVSEGFAPSDAASLLAAEWWPEMLNEVRETPEFCEPEDGSETVLRYARDVVGEYIRKRFRP